MDLSGSGGFELRFSGPLVGILFVTETSTSRETGYHLKVEGVQRRVIEACQGPRARDL